MDTQSPENAQATPTSRRALIASLIGAGAAVVVAGRASAADSASDTASTTVAPPSRSSEDVATLNSLLAAEADNVATYQAAKAKTSGDDLAVFELIESHHLAYVQAIEGYLGREAVARSGTAAPLTGTGYTSLAVELAAIEGQTVQTHVAALATLKGLNAAALVASIITAEARHRSALLVSASGSVNALAGN